MTEIISNTIYRISVMQAFVEGKTVQMAVRKTMRYGEGEVVWYDCGHPIWDWYSCDYRVKP